jgi:hypothetical protein
MKKIKIFHGTFSSSVQEKIDEWTEETTPNILDIRLSVGTNDIIYVAVLYEDTSRLKL